MLSLPVCFSYIKGEDDVVPFSVLLIYNRSVVTSNVLLFLFLYWKLML